MTRSTYTHSVPGKAIGTQVYMVQHASTQNNKTNTYSILPFTCFSFQSFPLALFIAQPCTYAAGTCTTPLHSAPVSPPLEHPPLHSAPVSPPLEHPSWLGCRPPLFCVLFHHCIPLIVCSAAIHCIPWCWCVPYKQLHSLANEKTPD